MPAACARRTAQCGSAPARKPAATAASRMPTASSAIAPAQQPAGRDNRRERGNAHPDRRLDRQGEIAGDPGAERHRQPDRPKTALLDKQGLGQLAQVGVPPATRDSCIRPERDCQLPRTRPMAKNPAAHAHRGGANTIGSRSHDRRHPLCPLAHRLSPYRRRPHGLVQLAVSPAITAAHSCLRIEDTDRAALHRRKRSRRSSTG